MGKNGYNFQSVAGRFMNKIQSKLLHRLTLNLPTRNNFFQKVFITNIQKPTSVLPLDRNEKYRYFCSKDFLPINNLIYRYGILILLK